MLDSATFAVFRRGYKKGFGADGDHLKTLEEIEYALRCGYSMITLDCSEYIDNTVQEMSAGEVKEAFCPQPERDCLYLNREFVLGGERLFFDEDTFCRGVLIYDAALKFIDKVYRRAIVNAGRPIDFEISIDETATVTHPLHHYFIARELQRLGIKVATVAPRFCGEFQKGIDYIGDTAQFERELRIHADIAEQFGYKLSIHSGSDKFRIFEIVGRVTKGRFHIKTAGTSWLEAMKAVAIKAPSLYREIHAYALESAFDEARKFYHVTTDLSRIPPLDSLSDEQLPELFSNSDARQLIHITYGHILGAKSPDGSYRFRERLYSLWRREREFCNTLLKNHIGAHLKRLTKTL